MSTPSNNEALMLHFFLLGQSPRLGLFCRAAGRSEASQSHAGGQSTWSTADRSAARRPGESETAGERQGNTGHAR